MNMWKSCWLYHYSNQSYIDVCTVHESVIKQFIIIINISRRDAVKILDGFSGVGRSVHILDAECLEQQRLVRVGVESESDGDSRTEPQQCNAEPRGAISSHLQRVVKVQSVGELRHEWRHLHEVVQTDAAGRVDCKHEITSPLTACRSSASIHHHQQQQQ